MVASINVTSVEDESIRESRTSFYFKWKCGRLEDILNTNPPYEPKQKVIIKFRFPNAQHLSTNIKVIKHGSQKRVPSDKTIFAIPQLGKIGTSFTYIRFR